MHDCQHQLNENQRVWDFSIQDDELGGGRRSRKEDIIRDPKVINSNQEGRVSASAQRGEGNP